MTDYNMLASEGAFYQTEQDFIMVSDVMMTGITFGWVIAEGQPHKCGSANFWIAPNGDGTAQLVGCVNCYTPRMIFTNN